MPPSLGLLSSTQESPSLQHFQETILVRTVDTVHVVWVYMTLPYMGIYDIGYDIALYGYDIALIFIHKYMYSLMLQ